MSYRMLAGFALCSLGAAACAGSEAPRARLASTQASLRAAEELGAQNVPKAQLHIQLAQENINRAEVMMQEGNNESASFVLMRAQSDAELALSLAKEVPAKREAQAALDKVAKLRPSSSSPSSPSNP